MVFESKIFIDEKLFSEKLEGVEYDFRNANISWKKIVIQMCLGIVMLFWQYTMLLGILLILIGISLIIIFIQVRNPKWIKDIKWKARKLRRIFEQPLRYGYNDYGLLIIGDNLDIKVSWNYLNHYKIKDNWIRVTVYGLPDFFYNIEELKKNNIFGEFILKLEQYCKETT